MRIHYLYENSMSKQKNTRTQTSPLREFPGLALGKCDVIRIDDDSTIALSRIITNHKNYHLTHGRKIPYFAAMDDGADISLVRIMPFVMLWLNSW